MSEYKDMKQGSEGSKWSGQNDRQYPITGKLAEYSPKYTDHAFESHGETNNIIMSDSPEMVRRKNSRARDKRNGFRVTNNGIYAYDLD